MVTREDFEKALESPRFGSAISRAQDKEEALQVTEVKVDYSEVIKALQVVVKTGSSSAGQAVEVIRQIRTQQTLPPQEDFDYIVQQVYQYGSPNLEAEEHDLIASLLTVVEDYQ